MNGFASLALALLLAATALAGCGDDEATTAPEPVTEATKEAATTSTGKEREPPPDPDVPKVECPAGLTGCETAAGEILYVERVDPDGDGDAHFVLISREAITGPGISVIDVRTDLRPDPLPGPGDLLAAAGPVYEGSYGQSQIQAEVVEVKYR